jgi:hypothetical protein
MADSLTDRTEHIELDGLWTAEFGSSTGIFGGGAVVFLGGKILGGDATYFYTGDYKLTGRDFVATIRVSPFIEGAESIFKTVGQELTLLLTGKFSDDRFAVATGHPQEIPTLNFGVKLTKRS